MAHQALAARLAVHVFGKDEAAGSSPAFGSMPESDPSRPRSDLGRVPGNNVS